MLKINLFNQGSWDKEKSTTSRKKSVLPSLSKTEDKIKNHNDNPANIQVNCLFPQHEKPKKTTTGATLGNKKLIKKLTCSSLTMPCSRACKHHHIPGAHCHVWGVSLT